MRTEATFVQYVRYLHEILTYNSNVAIIGLNKRNEVREDYIFNTGHSTRMGHGTLLK